jgi:hypothetical protein
MGQKERAVLIKQIEEIRKSKVLCFLTSLRPNVPSQIAQDSVRVIFDHLLALPERPVERLDLFLVSNGGDGTVPWRLTALFREFAKSYNVLIPYRAYSAATLIALGADEIVMHPFAELGPIDPTVSNDFNPTTPDGQPIGISVEDVKSYIAFLKTTVGITSEPELAKAIESLTSRVHPLAIGNIERFIAQSRMIARKIMLTHMVEANEEAINEIVENLASKLYFHGHPINRIEAKSDLKLKVLEELPDKLEKTMWDLYLDYEAEFSNRDEYFPVGDLLNKYGMPDPNKATKPHRAELIHSIIESLPLTSIYKSERRSMLVADGNGLIKMQEEILKKQWTHTKF